MFTPGSQRVRCDFLLAWPFLAALVALLINDFWLKENRPSPLSGILSDLAGMVFFPIALVALAELVAWALPSKPLARPSWFLAATALVGISLIAVKLWVPAATAYEQALSVIPDALRFGTNATGVVQDPVDLLALLLAPIPIWIGFRWRSNP